MSDGFFRITFTGHNGSGFGMLTLQNGVVVGADVTGTIFDGSYSTDSKMHKFQIVMKFPAGVTPVQTGVALTAPLSLPLSAEISEEDLNSEKPVLLVTPIGPVNVCFTKIRDFT